MHIELAARKEIMILILECIFTYKQYFTGYRATRQETTFTRSISRN